jgi:hypothetical protein
MARGQRNSQGPPRLPPRPKRQKDKASIEQFLAVHFKWFKYAYYGDGEQLCIHLTPALANKHIQYSINKGLQHDIGRA